MTLYLISNTPTVFSEWRRLAVTAESEGEVQALLSLVGDPAISISSSYEYEAKQYPQDELIELYGDAFELPQQASEVIRELLSWSE